MKPFLVSGAVAVAPAVAAAAAGAVAFAVGKPGAETPPIALVGAIVAVVYALIRAVEALVTALVRRVSDDGKGPGSPEVVLVEIRDLLRESTGRVTEIHEWLDTARPWSLGREILTFHKRLSDAIDRMERLIEANGRSIDDVRIDVRAVAKSACPIKADERLRKLLEDDIT